jgi:formate hydrogenlyase transcriptional activator
VPYANQATLDYSGLTAEDLHSQNLRERIFHPDDLQRLRHERKTALESGISFEFEQRALRKDGQYRWFLIRYSPFRDVQGRVVRWYVAGTDIDDIKRTEQRLREDERELRRITDAIPQAIVVQDPNGISLYANQATLDHTGLTAQDVIGPGFRERIFHPEDIGRLRDQRQAALSRGVPFEIEQHALRKDGQYRWFLIRYNPFRDEHGNLIRWYATGTDIDVRKRAEDRMRNETVALREEIVRSSMFEEIVGSSEALRKVLVQVSKVAPTDSTVLIQGETGTGKELIARAIHNRSKRANRAFIRVNCAALPPSLIASELFGHERGSFTGALHRRLGRFESADGGTIFLDEIGDLPAETQVALLRVLQEREIERIGGNQTIPVDVRVLTATNKDLSAAVAEGTFRQDLFYRLDVFPIQLPALSDRVDDIRLLVEYLVEWYAQKGGKRIRSISKETLDPFQSYSWPGNIRELQNVVERVVILCDGETFCVDASWLRPAAPKSGLRGVPLATDLAEREKGDDRRHAAGDGRPGVGTDRRRRKTGHAQANTRIKDQETRHRPVPFQDLLISLPIQTTSSVRTAGSLRGRTLIFQHTPKFRLRFVKLKLLEPTDYEWHRNCAFRRESFCGSDMTLRMDRYSDEYGAKLRLIGRIRAEHLPELEKQIRDSGTKVALDLEEVNLVDVEVVRFLGTCEAQGVGLLNCSPYIRDWIDKERD